jgi:hypothetical protein
MTKRRLIAIVAMAGALLVLGVVLWDFAALDDGPGVTKANCMRIKQGMTLNQVEAIMGRQADGGEGSFSEISMAWKAEDQSQATIIFKGANTRTARVSSAQWDEANESLLKKLGRWTGLW